MDKKPEYIERETLIKALEGEFEDNENCRVFVSEIPTADVVKVVRCKDCKHCKLQYPAKAKGEEAIEGYYFYLNREYVKPAHFCSYGELKEREG